MAFRRRFRRKRYGRKRSSIRSIARSVLKRRRRMFKRRRWNKKYGLKYNKPRVGIPNRKKLVLRHAATLYPGTSVDTNKMYWSIQGDQILSATNVSHIFASSSNAYPLGFPTHIMQYPLYRVNALKITMYIKNKTYAELHCFAKWCNARNAPDFGDLDMDDMFVHRGIHHARVKAYNPNIQATSEAGEPPAPVYTRNNNNVPMAKMKFYATRKGVVPWVHAKTQAFDKEVKITSATFDGATDHWSYTGITDAPVIVDSSSASTVNLAAETLWALSMKFFTVDPITGAFSTHKIQGSSVNPYGEPNVMWFVRTKWFLTMWNPKCIDDQESNHFEPTTGENTLVHRADPEAT